MRFVQSTAHVKIDDLSPHSLDTVCRLSMSDHLHRELTLLNALGEKATWEKVLLWTRDLLKLTVFHLRQALYNLRQGDRDTASFTAEFLHWVEDAKLQPKDARGLLVAALRPHVVAKVDSHFAGDRSGVGTSPKTASERLQSIPFESITALLT